MKNKIRMYLVKAREEKGYSMRKTARIAGMSFQHYSKVENGDRGTHVSFMIICFSLVKSKIVNTCSLKSSFCVC